MQWPPLPARALPARSIGREPCSHSAALTTMQSLLTPAVHTEAPQVFFFQALPRHLGGRRAHVTQPPSRATAAPSTPCSLAGHQRSRSVDRRAAKRRSIMRAAAECIDNAPARFYGCSRAPVFSRPARPRHQSTLDSAAGPPASSAGRGAREGCGRQARRTAGDASTRHLTL